MRKVAIATRGEELKICPKTVQMLEKSVIIGMEGEKIVGTVVANARTKSLNKKVNSEPIHNTVDHLKN